MAELSGNGTSELRYNLVKFNVFFMITRTDILANTRVHRGRKLLDMIDAVVLISYYYVGISKH